MVGESGCGKSVTALSIMNLIPKREGGITKGSICFDRRELTLLAEHDYRHIRGNQISMIFQEPMTSLNPVFTVGYQLAESLYIHDPCDEKTLFDKCVAALSGVGMGSAAQHLKAYPHQLSGGMKQRVMIAMALICRPRLLIADEPTTALDVTTQAQILRLLKDLQAAYRMSMIFITHDLGVVSQMADTVLVMYAGNIVESGRRDDIFKHRHHPYTIGLFNSIPYEHRGRAQLEPIEGMVPGPHDFPRGCRFHPRCPRAMTRCRDERPPLYPLSATHSSRCFLAEKESL